MASRSDRSSAARGVSRPTAALLLLACVLAARPAKAATCSGRPGWPLPQDQQELATVTVIAPLSVSDAGWSLGRSLATGHTVAGEPIVTDDLAACVAVKVVLRDASAAQDAAAASLIHRLGGWTPLAGNSAHFDATVEEFVDCAGAAPAAGQPAGGASVEHACSAEATGPHGEPVVAGPDGANGFWLDVGAHQAADLRSPGPGGAPASATILVPAELADVAAWIRVRVRFSEGDSRLGGGPVSWSKGMGPIYCPTGYGAVSVAKDGGRIHVTECKSSRKEPVKDHHGRTHDEYVYTSPSRTAHPDAGSFQSDLTSLPIQAVVLPAAIVKLGPVPYAIAYMPPGDQSKARLLQSITEGTTWTVGTTSGSSNSSGDVSGTCTSTSFGFSMGIFGTGFGLSQGELDCSTTTDTTGTTQGAAVVDAAYESEATSGGIDKAATAYATGDYAKEAFWYDTYTLALDQPAAVYDDAGRSVTRYLPVTGTPDWGEAPLIQLAACAYGRPIAGVADACMVGYAPDGHEVKLTADQAASLLGLDPFFPEGQSAPLDGASGRFAPLTDLGGAGTINCPAGSTPAGLACLVQATNTQGTSSASAVQAAVVTGVSVSDTNKDTEGWSLTLGVKYSGVGGGDTFGSTTSSVRGTVNATGATVGYFTSTAVSTGRAITFRATVADKAHDVVTTTVAPAGGCGSYPDPITLHPWQDGVFGGLLLTDPCAPKPPWWGLVRRPPLRVPILLERDARVRAGAARLPPALAAEWAPRFAADLDRAIAANPHLADLLRALPRRCLGPECVRPREPHRLILEPGRAAPAGEAPAELPGRAIAPGPERAPVPVPAPDGSR